MGEWDFESALKDYFGASTEDGDAPLGGSGSATFSAPSGWDFDKALNDYFSGGVNKYVAPRGYEFPDGWTQGNAPWEFSPPSEPPPPPSDYDQAAWFNTLQRRHEAWDQAREQQELLRAPRGYIAPRGYEFQDVSGTGAPEDFGLRHPGFVPPLPPGTPTGEWTQPNEWGVSYPVTNKAWPGGVNLAQEIGNFLGGFVPTEEEIEAIEGRAGGTLPYFGRQLGRALEGIGLGNEAVDAGLRAAGLGIKPPEVTIPGAEYRLPLGASDIKAAVGDVLQYSQVYPLFGAAIMEAKAQGPAQRAYDEFVATLNPYEPPTPEQQAKLDELFTAASNERQEGVRKQIIEMGLDPDTWRGRFLAAHRAYEENVPEAVRMGLSFVDPGNWALGLAGRGLFSRAKALAPEAADLEAAQTAKGLQPRLSPSTRLEKLNELQELQQTLATTNPERYREGWAQSLAKDVGRGSKSPIQGLADLTDAELDQALEVYRNRVETLRIPKLFPELGPRLTEFKHDALSAIRKLMELRSGDAIAALRHPEVGDIDLIWGAVPQGKNPGYGLAKIASKHPEVLDDLQGIIERLPVKSRTPDRIILENDSYRAMLSRDWHNHPKQWLLTAFEKNK